MTQQELITYKINRLGLINPNILEFINSLISDLPGTLKLLQKEILIEKQTQLDEIKAQQIILETDIVTLNNNSAPVSSVVV